MSSSWLNRAMQGMAPAGPNGLPLSVGVSLPLLLRGAAPVGAFAPPSFQQPQPDLYARLVALHAHDPVTGPAIREGLQERGFSGSTLGGWDTHAAQGQRLVGPLRQLNAGLVALKASLGETWKQTAVLVITEFGRTVHLNGTGGTDHGTGAAAFVAGGAVAGGRVLADGRGWRWGGCSRRGTCSRRWTCGRWRRACWPPICGCRQRWSRGRFRGARGVRRRGGCFGPKDFVFGTHAGCSCLGAASASDRENCQ